MISKLEIYLKRIAYITFSLLFDLGFISLNIFLSRRIYFSLVESVSGAWAVATLIFLLILLVQFVATLLLSKPTSGFIFLNTQSIFLTLKTIYHSSLGHFFISVSNSKVYLIHHGVFRIKVLYQCDINMNTDQISEKFKKVLDKIYTKRLEDNKEKDAIKKRKKEVLEWDGYLDKEGKRDNKIKELLK